MVKISYKFKFVILGLGVLVIIAASNYHGYRIGVTVGQEADILLLGEFLKNHHECIESNDLDCIKKTNEILLIILNSKISALQEKGIYRSNKEEIDKIKNWAEDTLAKYE